MDDTKWFPIGFGDPWEGEQVIIQLNSLGFELAYFTKQKFYSKINHKDITKTVYRWAHLP